MVLVRYLQIKDSIMAQLNSITQQAVSHVINITIPKSELDPKFDIYWDEVKNNLNPVLIKAAKKGGFRKIIRERVIHAAGGIDKFYEPVLMQHVDDFLDTLARQALIIESVKLIHPTETDYGLEAVVYLEPEITWTSTPGIDGSPLNITTPAEPSNLLNDLVEEILCNKQVELTRFEPKSDSTEVRPGDVVSVSCKSYVVTNPGTPEEVLVTWEPGTINNAKWEVSPNSIKQPELFDAILKAEVPTTVCVDMVLNEKFGADTGKNIRAILTIQQIFNKVIPEIDDELAKASGHETLDALKEKLYLEVKAKVVAARVQHRENGIIQALAQYVTMSPIPKQWSIHKGTALYNEGVKEAKTEQALLTHFNNAKCFDGTMVTNKNSLITFLAERATQKLAIDLLIRDWGRLANVDGDLTLKNISQYVQAVKVKLNEIAIEMRE